MAVTAVDEGTGLELGERGTPSALRWHRRLYRVTDAPTRLEDALASALTHPVPAHGWRFQATSVQDGETLVFDVLAADGGWLVVKTYR